MINGNVWLRPVIKHVLFASVIPEKTTSISLIANQLSTCNWLRVHCGWRIKCEHGRGKLMCYSIIRDLRSEWLCLSCRNNNNLIIKLNFLQKDFLLPYLIPNTWPRKERKKQTSKHYASTFQAFEIRIYDPRSLESWWIKKYLWILVHIGFRSSLKRIPFLKRNWNPRLLHYRCRAQTNWPIKRFDLRPSEQWAYIIFC